MIEELLNKIEWTVSTRKLPSGAAFKVTGLLFVNGRKMFGNYIVTKLDLKHFDSHTPRKDLEGLAKDTIKRRFRDIINREELHFLDGRNPKGPKKKRK